MKNSLQSIAISRDKLLMKQAFAVGGVSSPELLHHSELSDRSRFPSGLSKVAFKRRRGCKARGMRLRTLRGGVMISRIPPCCLDSSRYVVERFVPCVREYRAYVGTKEGGKLSVFHIDAKIPRVSGESLTIANHESCLFKSLNSGVRSGDVKRQAKRAARACGLVLAAVDVGLDSSGAAWVFETNTKPAIEREHVAELWEEFRLG